jgi:O-antigen/teichoic acid export membrane protein
VGVIKRQGIKNTLITYIGIVIGAVNMILIQPRYLSEEEVGLTRLLYFCAYLIGLLIPAGMPNVIVKFFPFIKDDQRKHYGFIGFISIVFLIGFLICATGLILLRPLIERYYSDNSALFVEYFLLLIPFTFIVAAITLASTYCQSLFKSTVPTFLNDIFVRLGVATITILYFNKLLTLNGYVYAFIGIYAFELLLLILFISSIDRITFRIRKELFEKIRPLHMIRFGLLLCVAAFASFGLRTVDGIILGKSSLALVGIYTTAVFVASFIEVPLGALERISHTKIADHFAKNDLISVSKIYNESVKYLLVIGGFLFIGINACTLYVYQIGGLPEDYFRCINVVYIVGLGALVNVATGVNSAIIYYSQYYILGTVFLVLTLLLTVILNLALIPKYGIYGAAIASLTGACVFNLTKFAFIYSKFRLQPYDRRSTVIFLSVICCAVLAHVLPEISYNPFLNLIFKGGVCTTIYLLVLYAFKLAPDIFDALLIRFRRITPKSDS